MAVITIADVRSARPEVSDDTKFPDGAVQAIIDGVVGYAEHELRARLESVTEDIDAPADTSMLPWSRVTAVDGATDWAASGWVHCATATTLSVTHGFDTCPPLIRIHLMDEIARELTFRSSRVHRNVLREVGDTGLQTTYSYADWQGVRPFGSPQLDTMLSSWTSRGIGVA